MLGRKEQLIYRRFCFSVYMSTVLSVPPPEDAQLDCESSNSVFHLGESCLLTNTTYLLGVDRNCAWFTFGQSNLAVDVWNANFDTPSFTVNAYLGKSRKLILSVGHADLQRALPFKHRAGAIVVLDDEPETAHFVSSADCPHFSGPDALYWAFREVLLR